jgi:phosphoglycolate phosphatase-like HAD superfamily hydrolase
MDTEFELMDGIRKFLIKFSRHYKIGILGQYGNDFKKFLEDEDVIKYFSYRETQDGYKITKPDPRYYEALLRKCNCEAEESIMVGIE